MILWFQQEEKSQEEIIPPPEPGEAPVYEVPPPEVLQDIPDIQERREPEPDVRDPDSNKYQMWWHQSETEELCSRNIIFSIQMFRKFLRRISGKWFRKTNPLLSDH